MVIELRRPCDLSAMGKIKSYASGSLLVQSDADHDGIYGVQKNRILWDYGVLLLLSVAADRMI
jgi:hypothetical protein